MNTHCPDHPAPRTLPLLVSLACLGMLGAAQAQPGPQAHATLPSVVIKLFRVLNLYCRVIRRHYLQVAACNR